MNKIKRKEVKHRQELKRTNEENQILNNILVFAISMIQAQENCKILPFVQC